MIPDIKKILYATDLSPNSAYALCFALQSAKLHHAEIIILHVFDRLYTGFAPMVDIYFDGKEQKMIYDERAAEARAKIGKRLELVCDEELRSNPDYRDIVQSIEVCEGFPAERILGMADEFDCDMIIMGTHGKGIIGNTFLGSTAKRVLRRTRKPIFIIPLPKDETDVTIKDTPLT
jgi:nucleotide-binding universal stress UspA family protein